MPQDPHPLAQVMAESEPFLLIGDSDSDRFPAASLRCYQRVGKDFLFLDLGSRELGGSLQGQRVFHSPQELPPSWGGDLALIWVRPYSATQAVEAAHSAGCRRVWFSFGAGSHLALLRCQALGVQVLEVGRCPVYFLKEQRGPCFIHGRLVRLTGARSLPPQLHAGQGRRELL